jgi:hypothetical protein
VIVLPPSVGAVQLTAAAALPTVAVTLVGAPGTVGAAGVTIGLAVAADVGLVAGNARSTIAVASAVVRPGLGDRAGSLPVQRFGGMPEGTAIGRGDGVGVGCPVGAGDGAAVVVCREPRPSLGVCGEKRPTTHSDTKARSAADPIMNAIMIRFELTSRGGLGWADSSCSRWAWL